MSAIVKAQLLKHLSKFVKNLSADHLTLKLLQGSGNIENIDLNEELLGPTLGLPPWLRLTRVHCNRMAIKLHWTRLTSDPIQVALDIVDVEVQAAEANHDDKKPDKPSSTANPFKMPYNFINKAIDGISITINTVKMQFRAGTFFASMEMSHVTLESCLPEWGKDIKHLKNTRIKNGDLKQVILFKLAKCNSLRLETSEINDSSGEKSNVKLTPFRVIINRVHVKIQFKRSLTDSSILCTKLQVEIDDILSVLTDAQVQVGLRFINHLRRLSAGTSVELAAKRASIARTLASSLSPEHQSPPKSTAGSAPITNTLHYHRTHAHFIKHDFTEHSTHVKLARVDLHLVAERASYMKNQEAAGTLDPILLEGAIRLSLENAAIHLYPAHILGSKHKGWPRYYRLFQQERTNLAMFHGCFEAIGYGSIDAVKLYAAQLPREHNPNKLCISICGARSWPAVYFTSSQVVSEKDLSIVDGRSAVRVSKMTVDFHLPTLLYLAVMLADLKDLIGASQDVEWGSSANSCTLAICSDLDLVYQPLPAKNEPANMSSEQRSVVLVSIQRVEGQLVERPERALLEPTFTENLDINENDLYSFLHSFVVAHEPVTKMTQTEQEVLKKFEKKCEKACSEIEGSKRSLWHWQLNSIFARTVTAMDGDIPMLHVPKIVGYMPKSRPSDDLFVMLKCDPLEGPVQLFAERAQFDELQEMITVYQNFIKKVEKSVKILSIDPIVEHHNTNNDSLISEILPQQTPSHILFLAPLVSVRLLLPAVPPLVVPLTADSSAQTGDNSAMSSMSESTLSLPLLQQQQQQQQNRIIKTPNLETTHEICQYSEESYLEQNSSLVTFGSTTTLDQTTTTGAVGSSSLDLFTSSSGFAETKSLDSQSLLNASVEDPTLSSSSSESEIADFEVVKEDEPLDDDERSMEPSPSVQNPLDPTCMNFGLQGGLQEVVSVQLVVEGLTASLESDPKESFPDFEVRFDHLAPIYKPRVLPRRDVYFPVDIPVDFSEASKKRSRRQYRISISDASDGRNCIDIFLPADDSIPPISMSAVNALAHFLSPDAPVTEVSSSPPIINIHTPSNLKLLMKMDTPNVYDHLPPEFIHFIPETANKEMVVTLHCPLRITQTGYGLTVAPSNNNDKQDENMQSEIDRLKEENKQLRARLGQL